MKYIQNLLCSLLAVILFADLVSCQTAEEDESSKPITSTIQAQDSVSIAFDMRGDGNTTLVFIHGWCSNREFWREQLDDMGKQHRVVAIDLPGHGESGRNREEWSVASFATDVAAVVKSLDQKQVVLIGHSMGGLVALEAAELLPEAAIGVIGIDAISNVESENQPDMMVRIIAALEADFKGTMSAFMPRMFSPNADSALVMWATESSTNADQTMATSIMREVSKIDEKELLSSAGIPVRCIYAATDDFTGPRSYLEINQKYADFDAAFVDGVGHFLYLESPNEVNGHISTFVNEMEQKASSSN